MSLEKKMNGLEIVKASPNDVSDMVETQYSAFPDDPFNLDKKDFELAIDDPSQTIWIAKYDNEFAGYIALNNRKFRPWVSLDNLIVKKQYRGKKIGEKLLTHAMKHSTRRYIRLFVEKKNTKAVKLYKANNFRKIYAKANHYENGDSALVLIAKT